MEQSHHEIRYGKRVGAPRLMLDHCCCIGICLAPCLPDAMFSSRISVYDYSTSINPGSATLTRFNALKKHRVTAVSPAVGGEGTNQAPDEIASTIITSQWPLRRVAIRRARGVVQSEGGKTA